MNEPVVVPPNTVLKHCTKCKQLKPYSEFSKMKRNKDGLYPYCKECHRDINHAHFATHKDEKNEWQQNRRATNRQLIWDYLLEHPCVDCGATNPIVLQFDHRDPKTKLRNIGDYVGTNYAWETIFKEIAKCDVRCANCHYIRNSEDWGWYKSISSEASSLASKSLHEHPSSPEFPG